MQVYKYRKFKKEIFEGKSMRSFFFYFIICQINNTNTGEKFWKYKHKRFFIYERALSVTIFTNPSAWAGYVTRSILKRSLTGLISEFSFS